MTDTPLGGAIVSLLVGLLLGLERERSRQADEGLFAGIRTFPILALCGFLAARAAASGAALTLPAVLLTVGALAVASYLRTADAHVGATTEIAALLAPLLGALVAWHEAALAAALAVVVTLLLTLKAPLHKIAGSISSDEILAILKFGVVAVVLVPLLPTQPLGPYGALVPRHVGLVVVVMSGVSLGGYLLVRTLGGHTGWALAGSLGGLVSSTAVTLSLAGKARALPALVPALGDGIVLASTVLYLRSLFLIFVFDQELGMLLMPRLGLLFFLGLLGALLRLRRAPGDAPSAAGLGNPVELGRALGLAALFAAILVGARAAQEALGSAGLTAAGLVGGLLDVDSVAVAMARLHRQGIVAGEAAAAAFLLGTAANLTIKGGITLFVGGAALARRVWPTFLILAAATITLLAF
jgi:uncharacterized membrane protein (DUF4010 family)